jgi:hypothetical protein
MNRYSRKTPARLISRDGDLVHSAIELPMATARRRVREWKALYERYGYEVVWATDEGSAIEVRMPWGERTFEAVAA